MSRTLSCMVVIAIDANDVDINGWDGTMTLGSDLATNGSSKWSVLRQCLRNAIGVDTDDDRCVNDLQQCF